ncbi:MAG TPA: metalloregulator ArsR/SmtB family transcription factor [Planctomycetaceae bacterium]|nr:metalloregulator ArsR/SmtB family transcription factor [Planctomycetaceae bacterium]
MVERILLYDTIFQSLADPTRRDILKRVSAGPLSIKEIAEPYKMSFAAVAKHVAVLGRARLVTKKRVGKEQLVSASAKTIKTAAEYFRQYEDMWNTRFDALGKLLAKR